MTPGTLISKPFDLWGKRRRRDIPRMEGDKEEAIEIHSAAAAFSGCSERETLLVGGGVDKDGCAFADRGGYDGPQLFADLR